jgi:catechol 2,3-dioxygenase-like lactoylglutathione lyase family enzyme
VAIARFQFESAFVKEGSMKVRLLLLCLLAFSVSRAASAQLAPPNERGVSMGHLHLVVQDVDAAKNFWMTFGGIAPARGAGIKFPGVIILLRKGDPTGPAVGSVTNHVGFVVPNVAAAMAKWKGAGLTTEAGRDDKQGFVITPDGLLRIEILEEPAMTGTLKFQHIHFFVPASAAGGPGGIPEIQAWYAKVFGAVPGKRGPNDSDDLPGVNLTFSKTDMPVVATKGRALDHIGFEVKDLEAFCKKESAEGIVFDRPCAKPTDKPGFNMYLTDPWGTYIELTEGLSNM